MIVSLARPLCEPRARLASVRWLHSAVAAFRPQMIEARRRVEDPIASFRFVFSLRSVPFVDVGVAFDLGTRATPTQLMAPFLTHARVEHAVRQVGRSVRSHRGDRGET